MEEQQRSTAEEKAAVINQITNEFASDVCSYIGNHGTFSGISSTPPKKGQFVLMSSWRMHPLMRRIGFITQVRVGCGQFRSDIVFIRLIDGELITFENESYHKLSPEHVALAREVFEITPEEEFEDDPEPEYSIQGKHKRRGFIINDDDTPGSPDTPFAITVIGR